MKGIYGGTFDPVHYGHLRTALEVREAVGLDEIRFVSCREPAHRSRPMASPEQRRKMLELALDDHTPGFVVDSRELERPGPSYMVDTLASLRSEWAGVPLCLITGLDAFRHLPAWHEWLRLFDLAHFIVMRRPNTDTQWPEPLAGAVAGRLVDQPCELQGTLAGRVLLLDVIQLDISATYIRQALVTGRSARYLLPDAVLDYISETGVYHSLRGMGYF
ncbi:MAG: nicotinate-nucleotide adenylyltransferase [Methylococcaceae bacterium]